MRKIRIVVLYIFTFFSFLFFAPSAFAYSTGMNASLVIGQPDFTSGTAGTASAKNLHNPSGIVIAGTKLIVADMSNNRVLIYNNLPTSNYQAADVVVGQPDMASSSINRGGSVAANSLYWPYSVGTDGTRLLISDYGNNRVLVYNSIPTTNGASADLVIGQSTMASSSATTSRTGLKNPMGVDYDSSSGKLIISDFYNARVLIYNSIPTTNGAAADVVVGQPDFVTTGDTHLPVTASRTWLPRDAKIMDNKLIVADSGHWRVLIFDPVPTTNGVSASVVLGQPDFTTDGWHSPAADSIDTPSTVHYDGSHLFVVDSTPRILIFNSIPATNSASANMVIGQSSFTDFGANHGGIGPNTIASNIDECSNFLRVGNQLFFSDTGNSRILRYTNDDPGYSVTTPPSGTDMVLTGDPDTSVTTATTSGTQTVTVEDGDTPISDVTIDFSQNRNWGSVVAATDNFNKAVIYIYGDNTGAIGKHTLYIPRGGKSKARICPNATSLSDVGTNCLGGIDFSGPFPQTTIIGSDTVTVNVITINSETYFVASGLSGTGGVSYNDGDNYDVAISENLSYSSPGSSSSSSPPGCGNPFPIGISDLFQIRTTQNGAKIFFTPTKYNTSEYVVAFGYSPGDIRFGLTVPTGDWRGVQSAEINHLSKNTSYYIQVRPGNGCATGAWSSPLKFTTNKKTYHKY